MTDQERLAEIKAKESSSPTYLDGRPHAFRWGGLEQADVDWLIERVEALEAENARLKAHVNDGTRPVRVRRVERF